MSHPTPPKQDGAKEMAQEVAFELDGRAVTAPAGTYVLQVARRVGVEIPTLCDHPALEPVGACRLCMVEVTHPDWGGWSGLMTSCIYPVAPGIQVSTKSPRVVQARRRTLALLAARCPQAAEIQQLAAEYEANAEVLKVEAEGDNCILCGLCTRVCETYATAAITTVSRGATKAVGSMGDTPSDCIGCGACALICPTGTIPHQRSGARYKIWGRTFGVPVCQVQADHCMGCGACEEACPFSVARVVIQADGLRIASIPHQHCRGCGACLQACPGGAIEQPAHSWQRLQERLQEQPVQEQLKKRSGGRS